MELVREVSYLVRFEEGYLKKRKLELGWGKGCWLRISRTGSNQSPRLSILTTS
jgi:hypothetical protein